MKSSVPLDEIAVPAGARITTDPALGRRMVTVFSDSDGALGSPVLGCFSLSCSGLVWLLILLDHGLTLLCKFSGRCVSRHIGREGPQDEWTLVDRRGRELTVPVCGGYEADDSRALGDATYAGLGIGVRPAGECDRAEQEGRLERVLPGYRFQSLDVYALVPKGRVRVPRVAACLEAIRAGVLELA